MSQTQTIFDFAKELSQKEIEIGKWYAVTNNDPDPDIFIIQVESYKESILTFNHHIMIQDSSASYHPNEEGFLHYWKHKWREPSEYEKMLIKKMKSIIISLTFGI